MSPTLYLRGRGERETPTAFTSHTMYFATNRLETLAILQNAQRLLDNPDTSDKVRYQQTEIVRVHRQHR